MTCKASYVHTIFDNFLFLNLREVQKAIQTSQNLYDRWSELVSNPKSVSKEELEWTTSELRNSLRSIEWDLEDLEETVDILSQQGCQTVTQS